MRYKCERCGANLDPGETCDCIEKEPPRGNVNGSDGDIADTLSPIIAVSAPVVNSFDGEPIRALRADLGLTQDECVAIVKSECPKFDVTLQSKCENSREYGVTYTRRVMEMMTAKLPPEKQKKVRYERGGRHKLTERFQCRIDPELKNVVQARMKKDGYGTAQELLASLLRDYAKNYWSISDAETAQRAYCAKNHLPMFAPSSGVCPRCGSNIYHQCPTTSGISVWQAATELITSCPHCNTTFCD